MTTFGLLSLPSISVLGFSGFFLRSSTCCFSLISVLFTPVLVILIYVLDKTGSLLGGFPVRIIHRIILRYLVNNYYICYYLCDLAYWYCVGQVGSSQSFVFRCFHNNAKHENILDL